MQFDFSNRYVLCKLLYWHTPSRFNSWRILLHSLGECDEASMSIIISCFKICNWVDIDVVGWV